MSQPRRDFLRASALFLASAVTARTLAASPTMAAAPKPITVYKDPNCGCCAKWVDHMKAAGFATTVHDVADVEPIKARYGVPTALRSCHTALVDGYVVEGHVPAADVLRLVRERPSTVQGIAVPDMPAGSPGMEMGPRTDRYDVVTFAKNGTTRVFAQH